MESQFRQPKQVINVEVNKQSIARNFGIGDNEVCYAKPGQPLTGYKAIYDKATQRAYYLPTGLTGTVVSISIAGVLTHSDGTVDLGALAVTREEFVTLPGSFSSGSTINVKNERLEYQGGLYRWDGVLPKIVVSGSTPESAGGFGSGKWISVGDAALRQELAAPGGLALVGPGVMSRGLNKFSIMQGQPGEYLEADLTFGFSMHILEPLTGLVDKSNGAKFNRIWIADDRVNAVDDAFPGTKVDAFQILHQFGGVGCKGGQACGPVC